MGSKETKSRSSSQASTSSLHLASLEDKAWTLGELRSNCAEEGTRTGSGSGTERARVRSHSEGLLSTELLLWLGHVGICLSLLMGGSGGDERMNEEGEEKRKEREKG